ncbi:uncharacterized protein [Bemisia tabaci]|uniref:uncharacterized protein isoform X2 n=1 Tax=Bemisia tabaci TaxID=7038 RepID=UPI001946BEAD
MKFRTPTEDDKSNADYPFKEEDAVFEFCEGNLNFATGAVNDNDEFGYNRKKITRDPMSHRIIEKRRRDRMNNCLADLSRLIPADYLKKGRGRIEKTEIIEMAIKHMKSLQSRSTSNKSQEIERRAEEERLRESPAQSSEAASRVNRPSSSTSPNTIIPEHFRLGFQECLSEAMHFLVEVEGFFANDSFCVQFMNHLQKHCDKILKSDRVNQPHTHLNDTSSSSSLGSKPLDLGSNSSTDGSSHPTGDQGYDSANSSQLRDILTSPHFFNHRSTTVRQAPLSPTLTTSSIVDGYSPASSLYKFKNNIKQRFSAEHAVAPEAPSPLMVGSSGTNLKRRRDCSQERKSAVSTEPFLPAPPSSKYQALTTYPSSCSDSVNNNYSIPIFALHSKGAFYVPLTVDFNTLAPFLNEQSIDMMSVNFSSLILHPVTISVNFCQQPMGTISRPMRLYPSSPSFVSTSCSPQLNQTWPQTNVASNHFQTLPKWATCTPETQ